MNDDVRLEDILFLDIETIPQTYSFNELTKDFQEFWEKKSRYFRKENETAGDAYERAGIYAEFGKIICISVGFVYFKNGDKHFRIKSLFGDDEKILLKDFVSLINDFSNKKKIHLCAHNGKEFDFPYLARRILINDIKLPTILNVAGKKPWEVSFLDTMEMWKFGDYKHFTSLDLLTHLFNIPTPKDDIDGSMVAKVYYEDHNLERIVRYCEKDVVAITQLYLKYKSLDILEKDKIESTTFKENQE